jgi:hypothetical protein
MRLRGNGLCSRRVDDEVVVLDLEQSTYLSFSGSGVVLFDVLQQDCEPHDLVSALVNTYGIDENTAREDVARFVEKLRGNGLLVDSVT